MNGLFKPRVRSGSGGDSCVELSEQDGVRALHLGSNMVQSAMRLSTPDALELTYTKCMMGFMLFHPRPDDVTMIGLGGGSLAKFVYHQLAWTKTVVVEINPQVVTAARSFFFLPPDDDRLQVRIAEGSEYISNHPCSTDVLMVDGFDDGFQASSLCSQDFYNRAREALKRNGVLVINLLGRDKGFQEYIRRIENSFNGHVATLTAEPYGNVIAFAFKHSPGRTVWENLQGRARKLEAELALPFTQFAKKLCRRKPV